MMSHVLEHEGIGGERGDGVLFEDSEEFVSGIGTRVEAGGTHSAEDLGSASVLGRRDLLKVGGTVVEFVAVKVIDLHAFGTRTIESFVHEVVAEFVAVTSHFGILTSANTPLHRGSEIMFDFLPLGIEEVAVRVSPEDFTANEIRRHLFATVA